MAVLIGDPAAGFTFAADEEKMKDNKNKIETIKNIAKERTYLSFQMLLGIFGMLMIGMFFKAFDPQVFWWIIYLFGGWIFYLIFKFLELLGKMDEHKMPFLADEDDPAKKISWREWLEKGD